MTSYVLINVTVPARLLVYANKSPAERTVGISTTSETLSFACTVRDFIVEDPKCEWISETPFINGKAWWVTFEFSCDMSYAETCVKALHQIGVGDEEDGRGLIHVVPVYIKHVGSRPKSCGRPSSLPFSAPVSPNASPRGTSFRKTPADLQIPALEVKAGDEEEPGSPQTDVTYFSDSPGPPQSEVNFSGFDFSDGFEVENETERLQAKLIAEVDKKEDKRAALEKYTENFADTVKSRVAVDSLVQYVTAASEFSYDYVMLILIAAIIACVGLLTNNQVVIVASMLVSPLMGPILAQTLGAVLSDHELVKRGYFAECMGLIGCVLVGYIGGLCAAPVNGTSWPTDEMASRAVWSALYIGIAIAIPSGAGAALSVMGNNTSSLVGVAISASLLPPAVNAGILWAGASLKNTGLIGDPANYVSGTLANDSAALGGFISFFLTILNIVCIFFSAYLMFEIKEVRGANSFWKEDIANVRKYNRALRDDSAVASIYQQGFKHAAEKRDNFSSGRGSGFQYPLEKIRMNWSRATSAPQEDKSE